VVLSWFGSGSAKGASVGDLIARKKYDKALELLRQQFKQGSRDPRLRLQMADVLVLSGRGKEAVPILVALADEYASEGFAAKAIALFKKIDKLEPGRRDVETKLAGLIQEPAHNVPLRPRAPTADHTAGEIGLSFGVEAIEAPAAPSPAPAEEGTPPEAVAAAPGPDVWDEEEEEVVLSEDAFRDQLLDIMQESLAAPVPPSAEPPDDDTGPIKSPLFGDFSQEELMAVMEGLRLLTFGPGDIIITEGEPGDSLFVLTTGFVKAWIRNPQGRHVQVRQMEEGSFFGEIALLTGKPRTATVTAGAACELLELDRATLDGIAATHPRVLTVLEDFHRQRAGNAAEATIRAGGNPSPSS
jgi:hypothetical protein